MRGSGDHRSGGTADACVECLRRAHLLALLAPHVERARHERRLSALLALSDADVLAAVGGKARGRLRAEFETFDAAAAIATAADRGLGVLCRHADGYPARLHDADDPAAVLYVRGDAGGLPAGDAPAVAIVGARRATPYGLEVARALGRGLAAAGLPVISGMALGIDAAAHTGALEVGGPTVAVLAGGADVPYPRSKTTLHRRISSTAGCCVVAEMPPGFAPFKWGFPARNRIIAGLAEMTVVVEAAERSGSLITAELAQDLGRAVAAVPGAVTNPLAAGTNALLRDGAELVRHAQDVLDALLGAGVRVVARGAGVAGIPAELRAVLDRLGGDPRTPATLVGTGESADAVVAALAELELLGLARRAPGGAFVRAAG